MSSRIDDAARHADRIERGRQPVSGRRAEIVSRRSPRKERTPYYVTDLPPEIVKFLASQRRLFMDFFGRDYEGEDGQFWFHDRVGDRPLPYPELADAVADGMQASNHHPAHIYAVRKLKRVICEENFKDVPDEWTVEWQAATLEYEKWGADVGLDVVQTKQR